VIRVAVLVVAVLRDEELRAIGCHRRADRGAAAGTL
jgi:hypothetical protein